MKYYTIYLRSEPRVRKSYTDPDGMVAWQQIHGSPDWWSCLLTGSQMRRRRAEGRVIRGWRQLPRAIKREFMGRDAPIHVWGPAGSDRDPEDDRVIDSKGRDRTPDEGPGPISRPRQKDRPGRARDRR